MRLLVVEDDEVIAKALKKGLEQEAFAVDVANDGKLGFDMGASEDYDVIILDLMLPNMDGITICNKLRSEENIQTPILMLTAKGNVEDKVKGLNSGADDYLPKPFAFDELLARVKALTRRPKQSLHTFIKVDDLWLDSISNEVSRGKEKIELSKKEFTLLTYLMRNKRKTISKQQIIDHVWDYDADILPNTVEVYIGYLRNKIDKGQENKLIKTIRGFGYRIG